MIRQKKLDVLNKNRTRWLTISADHMLDGFHYICKPQWQGGGMAVMTQRDIMMQYVPMRMFSLRASQGVTLSSEQGYACMRRYVDDMS